jgi:hypothetical protein
VARVSETSDPITAANSRGTSNDYGVFIIYYWILLNEKALHIGFRDGVWRTVVVLAFKKSGRTGCRREDANDCRRYTGVSRQRRSDPSLAVVRPQSVELAVREIPAMGGGRSTELSDPRWKILNQRDKTDPGWRGKVEIEFYGKVVDEKNLPVAGAMIKLSRGDLSPAGTTQVGVQSDADGLFSLTGVVGRGLNVSVEKMGYYTSKLNRYSYEYAEFSDRNFHQPEPSNPVIFHLRKKQGADALFYREQEFKVTVGAINEVTLDTGAKLQIELLANPRPRQGPWAMRVTVLSGGLQSAAEEFPFLAPTDDYQSSLTLDDDTPKPPGWAEIYEGGAFYLKSRSNYGRLEIQMISGRDWMRIKTWLNPSGSRNLEFDPAKAIKPKP